MDVLAACPVDRTPRLRHGSDYDRLRIRNASTRAQCGTRGKSDRAVPCAARSRGQSCTSVPRVDSALRPLRGDASYPGSNDRPAAPVDLVETRPAYRVRL